MILRNLKKLVFVFLLVFLGPLQGSPILELAQDKDPIPTCECWKAHVLSMGAAPLFFNQEGQPTVPLLALLELVGMQPLDPSENALTQINAWAQQNLLRYKERWDVQTTTFEKLAPKLLPLFQQLGFLERRDPKQLTYQGALVLGASVSCMRLRLDHLVECWDHGIRFCNLYFLSSARPLDRTRELQDLPQIPLAPATEVEAMLYIWEHMNSSEQMRQTLCPTLICSAMHLDLVTGQQTRPTTTDTIEEWLQSMPSPGNYLVISNAPYLIRQDLEFKIHLPPCYSVETVGPAAEKQTMAILLDEMARFIFDLHTSII